MLEIIINQLCIWLGMLPLDCMQYNFMQLAMLSIIITTPLAAASGIQVLNFRMAFFADTISHSAFAGAALGIILLGSSGPVWTMPLLALLIALGVMYLKQTSNLSADTVIGVFFAFVVSGGLLLLSVQKSLAQISQTFIFGDILTVTAQDIGLLLVLEVIYYIFQIFSFNAMQIIAIDQTLARAHRIKSAVYSYFHIALLALIIILCVKTIGVLLAGALMIVPAAAARNLAASAGGMFYWSVAIGLFSGICGLLISAQEWADTASGATIVMTGCVIFIMSVIFRRLKNRSHS